MHTRNIIIVILLVIIVLMLLFYFLCPLARRANCSSDTSQGLSAIEAIATRTSIRAYTDEPVDSAQIDLLLRSAMAAPTAGNLQPWRFVVISDGTLLRALADCFRSASMVAEAPVAILVCGDLDNRFQEEGLDYWVQDCSAATENLLLAAHASGLGAVWCGVHPIPERVQALRELLHLPDNICPLNIVALGHPSENPNIKNKWKPENIHYNLW